MVLALLNSGFQVEIAPAERSDFQTIPHSTDLLLAAVSEMRDIPKSSGLWYAWLRVDNPEIALAAYQSGARAVFPVDISPNLLALTIRPSERNPNVPEVDVVIRRVNRGSPIFLDAGSVLTVLEGVLATVMIHNDGANVLLGLTGPGQILVGHPADECFIEILAHTNAVVSIQPWEKVSCMPGFIEKLRTRLRQMEGWSARQARPYLPQRMMGILSLLAEQFGTPCQDGTLIDVRLTHARLASAVGANRSTVTRVLGELSEQGKIKFYGTGNSGRIILCENMPHGPH
jgi:CRP-like cAMP-binding protein